MEQWLAHKMEVQEYASVTKFVRDDVKFRHRQPSWLTSMLRTEVAVQVAHIGYLYIAAVYHIIFRLTINSYIHHFLRLNVMLLSNDMCMFSD